MRALLLAVAILPAIAAPQWQLPLDVRNHRSADLVFLRLAPRSHTLGQAGRYLSLSLVGANEFHRLGPIDEDAETWRFEAEYGWSLNGGIGLFVGVPLVSRSGGILDPIISWWHDVVIRVADPERDATPRGRSHIEFPGGGPFGSAFNVGDTTVGASKAVGGALFRVAVKLPTGNAPSLTGSGAADVGAALDYRFDLGPTWTLDLNGSVVLQGRATRISGTRRSAYSSAVALTYVQSSRDAWTVQWNAEQYPTKTGDPGLDIDHRVISFGYQRRLRDETVLQLYFSENGDFMRFPGGPTVGPDFTVGARLVRRQ